MRFDPKLGRGIFAMHSIFFVCTQCISTLYTPWIPGMPSHQQPRYKPVKDCTYWTVFGSFEKCNINLLSNKAISSEDVEKINQVLLDRISYNMAALVKTSKYGAINSTYTTTMV